MGGRGSSSKMQRRIVPQPQPQPQPQPVQAQAPDADGFSDTDSANYHDLYNGRNYYSRQTLDIDTKTSLVDYLDPNTTPGTMYNFSQNMNHAIANGQKLSAQQQFAYDSIVGAMHNIGYNLNLTRYDHGDYLDVRLKNAGINGGHANMSAAQLKRALVGQTYTDARILSTSYNGFKRATNASTFTTREVKLTFRAKASTQALMPGTGPGGDFGEMLLGPSGNGHNTYRIVDVKSTGAKARPKGGSVGHLSLNQIEVVIEVD